MATAFVQGACVLSMQITGSGEVYTEIPWAELSYNDDSEWRDTTTTSDRAADGTIWKAGTVTARGSSYSIRGMRESDKQPSPALIAVLADIFAASQDVGANAERDFKLEFPEGGGFTFVGSIVKCTPFGGSVYDVAPFSFDIQQVGPPTALTES
jgi:hypothetical protein